MPSYSCARYHGMPLDLDQPRGRAPLLSRFAPPHCAPPLPCERRRPRTLSSAQRLVIFTRATTIPDLTNTRLSEIKDDPAFQDLLLQLASFTRIGGEVPWVSAPTVFEDVAASSEQTKTIGWMDGTSQRQKEIWDEVAEHVRGDLEAIRVHYKDKGLSSDARRGETRRERASRPPKMYFSVLQNFFWDWPVDEDKAVREDSRRGRH